MKSKLRKARTKVKKGGPVERSRKGRQKAAKLRRARKPVDEAVKIEEPLLTDEGLAVPDVAVDDEEPATMKIWRDEARQTALLERRREGGGCQVIELELKSQIESLVDCSLDSALAEIENPEFEDRGRVHDWRNHVPSALRRLWVELSAETRMALFVMAKKESKNEDWD